MKTTNHCDPHLCSFKRCKDLRNRKPKKLRPNVLLCCHLLVRVILKYILLSFHFKIWNYRSCTEITLAIPLQFFPKITKFKVLYMFLLGWPISSFRFLCYSIWKNPYKLLGQLIMLFSMYTNINEHICSLINNLPTFSPQNDIILAYLEPEYVGRVGHWSLECNEQIVERSFFKFYSVPQDPALPYITLRQHSPVFHTSLGSAT